MAAPQPVSPPRGRRSPSWAEQLVPTYTLLAETIESGDRSRCVELIDYIDSEWIGINFGFYSQWHADTERFLSAQGVSDGDIEGLREDLAHLVNEYWNPGFPYDREAELTRYRSLKARLLRHLTAGPKIALATLKEWKELWRSIHDRDVDYASGLVNAVCTRFGEERLEELYRFILEERFDFRYAKFDVSKRPWSEAFIDLVHVSIEAQRSHLAGPERDGSMVFEEHDDRVELTFEPCATGGRTLSPDRLSGTPARTEQPFYLSVMQGKHDFAWNKEGVCLYCVHCAMLVEKLPMERYGYPLRVIDPPIASDGDGRCRWTIYRNLRDIPESAYAAMGERKPGPDEPLGSGPGRKMNRPQDA